ncbi:hypothetical protein D3C75_1029780 [compost metagenome]
MGFCTRPIRVAEVDGGIKIRVGEQERPRAVGQVDRHFRVFLLEILESRQQPLGAEGRNYGQFDHVGALLAHHGQGVALNGIELSGHPTAVGESGFRQLDPAPRASEQFHAEELFKAGDLSANRPLGQRQFLGGLGEALVARRGLEADQGGGAGYLSAHVRQPH